MTALYRGVLGRAPDPQGLQNHVATLTTDPLALDRLAMQFCVSDEHVAPFAAATIPDHSQFGEYPLLLRALVADSRRHGIVVDIGARGRDRSNAYDLLKTFGWKGLLVEANPALQETIAREFAGTDHVLVGCAVGIREGTMPLYLGVNDDISSLRRESTAGWGDLRGSVDVEVRRLAAILDEHAIPHDFDILSLDIEGLDVEVFDDLIGNSPYRPRYVVIEASYEFRTKSLADVGASLATQDAYDLIAQTSANLILRKR